jgi:thiamine kinase-like enzyme
MTQPNPVVDFNLDQLEELEERIVPLLQRRGIEVEAIQPIGLLGKGAHSLVYSLLINDAHHVLKIYLRRESYEQEVRNLRKLASVSKVILNSRRTENSLKYDLIMTRVPVGRAMTSEHLQDWVRDHLGHHLVELHRIRRRRKVDINYLLKRLERFRHRAVAAVTDMDPKNAEAVAKICNELEHQIKLERKNLEINRSLLHGDLWWNNIIVTSDEVYLIDWESVHTGDAMEDLAMFRGLIDCVYPYPNAPRFWVGERQPEQVDQFLDGIINLYRTELGPAVDKRLKIYFALFSLMRLRVMQDLNRQQTLLDIPELTSWLASDLIRVWRR